MVAAEWKRHPMLSAESQGEQEKRLLSPITGRSAELSYSENQEIIRPDKFQILWATLENILGTFKYKKFL